MKCRKLIEKLEELCPRAHAESWDNPGLIAGDFEKEIRKVYIALDATGAVIDDAVREGADLIITHHPLIFSGIKQIHSDDFTGRRLLRIIGSGMGCYAMHTNFDVDVMGQLAADMLGLRDQRILDVTCRVPEGDHLADSGDDKGISIPKEFGADGSGNQPTELGIGRFGRLPRPMTLLSCAGLVKNVFGISDVRVYGDVNTPVQTAAVCPGSGRDLMAQVKRSGADVYISGDFGHHSGIDAVEDGICVIDAGHQGIEHIFIDYVKRYIETNCAGVAVATEHSHAPFVTV